MAGGWFDVARDVRAAAVALRRRFEAGRPGAGEQYLAPEWLGRARRAVEAIHPPSMRLELTEVIREAEDAVTLRFRRLDGLPPPFRAGQYLSLAVTIDGVRTNRAYSISSPPGASHIDLTVRKKPGGFVSPWLVGQAAPGMVFESSGPAGHFHPEPLIDRPRLLLLAGGSGITPFISMLREQRRLGWPLSIGLLYGSRTTAGALFRRELESMARGNPRFDFLLVPSEEPARRRRGPSGLLSAGLIGPLAGDPDKTTVLMCGPNAMYDFCRPELAALGIPPRRIRTELYGPPERVTEETGWPRRVAARDSFRVSLPGREPFVAQAGEPLICSLERTGIVVPARCRSGECACCRMRLLSGSIFTPARYDMVREADRASRHFHACVAYPVSDIAIDF